MKKYKVEYQKNGKVEKSDNFYTVDMALQSIRDWTIKIPTYSFCFLEEGGKWLMSVSRWKDEVIFLTEKSEVKLKIQAL